MIENILFFLAITTGVSAIFGLILAILYLIFRQNSQKSFQVFICAFIGGWLGGIAGFIVGCFIGWIADQNTPGSIFVIDGGILVAMFLLFIFGILGIIVGAVVGGFRGMNTIDE